MNVSELGLVTPAGKVVWGKIASLYLSSALVVESVNDEGSNWIFLHTQESMLK